MDILNTSIFKERVAFLKQSEFWSKEKILDFQLSKFKHLVEHVEKYIPF